MSVERAREPLPRIELPVTYGDLYAFMTLTCNGVYNERRHEFFEDANFQENERFLRQAMSSPDAANDNARLPANVMTAAKLYMQQLRTETGMQQRITSTVHTILANGRALFAMITGKKEVSPELQ